jgi:hypothetical protein
MFGVDRLKKAFQRSGQQVVTVNLKEVKKPQDITVSISPKANSIQKEGYHISLINKKLKITRLLKAYADASQMPLKLASFFAATWDYTLYSEDTGCTRW